LAKLNIAKEHASKKYYVLWQVQTEKHHVHAWRMTHESCMTNSKQSWERKC